MLCPELALYFLKPGDADGKVCQHEAPVELQPLPRLAADNVFAYGNGEGQIMRDTLAASAKSLTDACCNTKLSICWRGPINHYFLYHFLYYNPDSLPVPRLPEQRH